MRINRVKLITIMAAKDMSTKTLAERSGISRPTISSVRSGKSCSAETALLIARALNVPVESLIDQ